MNSSMTSQIHSLEESEIEATLEEWAMFVETKNIDGVMSLYAEDVISFDLVEPFEYKGIDESMKRTKEWFATFNRDIKIQIDDLFISAEKFSAYAHCLIKYSGKNEDMWLRVTFGFQKIENDWMIKHMHSSVPFDMSNGKAIIKDGDAPIQ